MSNFSKKRFRESALFWNFAQRRMAVSYRSFGTTYRSNGTDKLFRNVGKLSIYTAVLTLRHALFDKQCNSKPRLLQAHLFTVLYIIMYHANHRILASDT